MKFVEMRDYLIAEQEYGYRFMIADEMNYAVDDAGEEVKDEVFEMLCERAGEAYLKSEENVFEIYQLCRAVYNMYATGTLEDASAWDILNRVVLF